MKDWAAFIGMLGFTILGLFVFDFNKDWGKSVTIVAFFGLGALFMGDLLINKYRFRHRVKQSVRVELPGHVPFYSTPRKMWSITFGLILLGVLFAFVAQANIVIKALGFFVLGVGVWLFALMLGPLSRRSMTWTEEGIQFAESWGRYTLHWDNIQNIQVGDMSGQYMIYITPLDVQRVAQSIMHRPLSRFYHKLLRRFYSDTHFNFTSITIMPMHYGLEAARTYQALREYWQNAHTRQRLAVRRLT